MIVVVQRLCLRHGCGKSMLSGIEAFKPRFGIRKWTSIEVLSARSPEQYEEYIVTTRWELTGEQFERVHIDWYGAIIANLPASGIIRYECSCYDTVLKQEEDILLPELCAKDGRRG
ncbi:hypothetical protein ACFFNY_31170 [Paenibacillus hodogayensis]|uniref:Uncharacterized protein n=1 Tax=Paenibacillus hodogayensis TaxID=279208 RepID=A0ABV5W661_9BACL